MVMTRSYKRYKSVKAGLRVLLMLIKTLWHRIRALWHRWTTLARLRKTPPAPETFDEHFAKILASGKAGIGPGFSHRVGCHNVYRGARGELIEHGTGLVIYRRGKFTDIYRKSIDGCE